METQKSSWMESKSKGILNRISRMSSVQKFWLYLLIYSFVFIIGTFLAFIYFKLNGKSFIWANTDGIQQHYPFLKYFCSNATDMIKEFLQTGQLSIKEWDTSLGLGSSLFMSLSNAGMFDPVTYLALLSPEDSLIVTYGLLIIIRIYLAGLSFSYMCAVFKRRKAYALIGSVTYCFSGFILYAGVRHPFFVSPMIMLPLIIAGFEKIRTYKRPYLFCISIALSLIMNFYFFFMMTIILFVYAVVKYFVNSEKETRWTEFRKLLFRSIGYYLIGIILSAWFLLPLVAIILTNSRKSGGYSANFLYYPLKHYVTLFTGLARVDASNGIAWVITGFSPLAVVSSFTLFTKHGRKHKELRILTITSIVALVLPVVGFIFSAMTYINNRWTFALPLLTSFTLVTMLPAFKEMNIKNYMGVFTYLVLGIMVTIFLPNTQNPYDIVGYLLIALAVILLIALGIYNKKHVYVNSSRIISFTAILGFSILCVAIAGNQRYEVGKFGYVKEFVSKKDVSLGTIADQYAVETGKNEISRNEIAGHHYRNAAMNTGYMATSQNFSLYNSNLYSFLSNLKLHTYNDIVTINSMDSRAPLLALWNTNTFVSTNSNVPIPYGFKLIDKKKDKTSEGKNVVTKIYNNEYPLDFGYSYNKFVSQEDYDSLNPVEKQQLLLHAAVISDENKSGIVEYADAKSLIKDEVKKIPYSFECSDGITLKDGKIVILKPNATITFKFDSIPNSEYYLAFDKYSTLYYDMKRYPEYYSDEYTSEMVKHSMTNNSFYVNPDSYILNLKSRINKKTISTTIRSKGYSFNTGMDALSINLGYQKNGANQISISFNLRGEFSFEDLGIYAVPMDNYGQQISDLNENHMDNLKLSTDSISGTMDLQEDKMVCLSIPYTLGWNAKVNGEDAELIKINDTFTGIYLKAGHNKIDLAFKLPMLRVGILISAIASIVCLLCVAIYETLRRNKRKKMKAEQ